MLPGTPSAKKRGWWWPGSSQGQLLVEAHPPAAPPHSSTPNRHTCLGPVVLGSFDVLAPVHPVDEFVQRVVVDGLDVAQAVQRQDEIRAVLVVRNHPTDGTLLAEQQEGGGRWRGADRGAAGQCQSQRERGWGGWRSML